MGFEGRNFPDDMECPFLLSKVKDLKASSQSKGLKEMYDFSILRDLRRREGLSIGGLSKASGVSPAVISKLERNLTAAGLDTVFRLARAFGMNSSDILSLAESRSAQRAAESSHDSGGFHFRQVQYGNVRCLYGVCKRGAKLSRPEVHNDDYELCWILEGRIKLSLPHESHALSKGGAVQFDALLEHSYEALADSSLVIFQIRKPKRF